MRSLIALALVFAGCAGAETEQPAPAPAPAPAPEPTKAPPPKAQPEVWKLPEGANPALTNPSLATEQAPNEFKVKFDTTKGDFVVKVNREWAPNGADRFYNLVKIGFYDQAKFFRAIDGFMVQFGISGYPEVASAWRDAKIPDDAVKQSNSRGKVTFATAGPNTRTTQLFINYGDNKMLDPQGFSPFGEVIEGMDVVDQLFKGYGEGAPRGRGPDQGAVQRLGNAYLEEKFPKLDAIEKATIVE